MLLGKATALIFIALATSGCASKLRVWGEPGEIKGVPFNAPKVVRKEFTRNRHTEFGEKCTPTPVVQTVTLPLGERFYANVDLAQLAKTGFGMNFSDSGALSQITLNTEPASADTIKATTEAITSLAPLLGVGSRSAVETTNVPTSQLPACDAGEENVEYHELKILP